MRKIQGMNNTIILLSILIFVLVFATIFVVLRLDKMKDRELRLKAGTQMKLANLRLVMPLRIQAYERLLLFLERIQMSALVKRNFAIGMDKNAFHLAMVRNVGDEFEHNIAQQLYVSDKTWQAVKDAEEEIVLSINGVFDKSNDDTDVAIIAQALVTLPSPLLDKAVIMLKREFDSML